MLQLAEAMAANQNASRSEKALDRGQTLRSNQPIERETKCRTAITFVIGIVTFQIVSRRALHLTASRHKTLHNCNTVKTPVCLWQCLFKTTCKNRKNEMKRQLLSLTVSPFQTQIQLFFAACLTAIKMYLANFLL